MSLAREKVERGNESETPHFASSSEGKNKSLASETLCGFGGGQSRKGRKSEEGMRWEAFAAEGRKVK